MERKYTVRLSEELVKEATHELGASITETIRIALELIRSRKAQRKMLDFFGKVPGLDPKAVRDQE